jgi:uncharacterized membrane protein HdeD (DUF308 family)
MANAIRSGIHRATTWSIVVSILMIVAGVLAICVPLIAGVAITAIVAWMLIFSGLLHLAFAWRAGSAGGVVWEIVLGILYGVIGFYMFYSPVAGLASVTLAIAAYLLIEGVLEFVLSFQLRPAPGSSWLLFDGIITLLLAVMIWSTWPSSAAWVVGTLIGISMFFSGTTRLMMSLALRRMTA